MPSSRTGSMVANSTYAGGRPRRSVARAGTEAAARGLVEVGPNPAHRKSSLIRLTPHGRDLITAVIDRERTVLRQVANEVTATDIAGCVRVLSCLLRLLDNVDLD